VELSRDERAITGRFGGSFSGADVQLALVPHSTGDADAPPLVANRIAGRVGGDTIGFDCDLRYSVDGTRGVLTGRLGGRTSGMDVGLRFDAAVDPLVVAVLACAGYRRYEEFVSLVVVFLLLFLVIF